MLDDITQAVLAREDVARYLRGGHGQTELEARERIHGYLDELRTTQRYPIYRALKHPLYPILRKIERIEEGRRVARAAPRTGRTIYISNHKSHLDYLIEPLVLDDNGIRPPVIAAGINLFGGPLGLLHRHVTGAIPIRRNTKDPGVPRHAQGVRCGAAAAARPDVLHRGRPQLLRRDEGAQDGAAARRDAERPHRRRHPADGDRLRPGARGSRARASGREAAAAAVRSRDRGDGALRRRAISRARS